MYVLFERRDRRAAAVLVIGLLAGVVAACSPSVDSSRVLVVGDSILNQSVDPVRAALEQHGWAPITVAYGGTAIEQWVPALPNLVAEHDPSIVVIELGTNDCTSDVCPTLETQINQVLDAVKPAQQVLWLNVQTTPDYPSGAKQVNVALAQAAGSRPNVRIVDFSDDFAGHPEWLDQGGPHLTPDGQQAFARLIADAVDKFHVKGT
jgi:lysophospholipase L1-like esterase